MAFETSLRSLGCVGKCSNKEKRENALVNLDDKLAVDAVGVRKGSSGSLNLTLLLALEGVRRPTKPISSEIHVRGQEKQHTALLWIIV